MTNQRIEKYGNVTTSVKSMKKPIAVNFQMGALGQAKWVQERTKNVNEN